jgi:hypothetical protein
MQKALAESLHKIVEDMVKNSSSSFRAEPVTRPNYPRQEENDDEDEAMSYQSGGRPGGPPLTQHNVQIATQNQFDYSHQTEDFGEEIPKADRTRGGPVGSDIFPPLQAKVSQKRSAQHNTRTESERGPIFSQQSTSSAQEQDRMALGKFTVFSHAYLIIELYSIIKITYSIFYNARAFAII